MPTLRSASSNDVKRRVSAPRRQKRRTAGLLAALCLLTVTTVAQNVPAVPDAPQAATPVTSPASSPAVQATATDQKSQHAKAEEQLRQQEKQRILGVIPNFNTTDIQDAAPLSPGQKFRLAYRSAIDPFEFVAAGMLAGFGQATDNHAGYGQGFAGYSKRYGAAYADSADGVLWGNAVLPVLLHQDPRYFRMGHGSIKRRIL